jgi:hypothetical protein
MLVLMPAPIGPTGAKLRVNVVAADTVCATPNSNAQPNANDTGETCGIGFNDVRFSPFVNMPLTSGLCCLIKITFQFVVSFYSVIKT